MANTHIAVDQSIRLGQQLRRCVDMTREVIDLHEKLKDVADQAADAPVWTGVEDALGVPTGDGETVYNLLAGSLAAINVAAVNNFLDRLG